MVCEFRYQNQTFTAVQLDEKLKALPLSQLRQAVEGMSAAPEPDVRFSFAGRSAKTAAFDALEAAQDAIAKGKSPIAARNATGWWQGIDGQWRYEITDHEATLKRPEGRLPAGAPVRKVDAGTEMHLPLHEVLQHDRLFAAYPEARNIELVLTDYGNTGSGHYNYKDNLIQLNRTLQERHKAQANDGPFGITQAEADEINAEIDTLGQYRLRDPSEIVGTLLHELQHFIQRNEGFAKGGAPNPELTEGIKRALAQMSADEQEAFDRWKYRNAAEINDADQARIKARYSLMYQSAQNLQRYASSASPSGMMRHIRGEMQWLYEHELQGHPLGRQLQHDFYNIPKPHKLAERNAFLADFARKGAQLLKDEIPPALLHSFESDPRTTKSLVNALQRESRKANDKLKRMHELKQSAEQAEKMQDTYAYAQPLQVYQALAGEIEARNTEARRTMNDEQRRRTHPEATADVPQHKAIVLGASGYLESPHIAMTLQAVQSKSRNTANTNMSYQIDHKPMSKEGGAATLDDLTTAFPDDIYSPQALQFYGSGDARERAVLKVMQGVRGKPDAKVEIYRGVPAGVEAINPGDWVTLSQEAAQDYADGHEGGQVLSMQVPAAHVTSWADSLMEFGYYPGEQATQSKRRNPQEDTEAFKAWFGDSKVVDDKGNPQVMYHGTTWEDITAFRPGTANAMFFTSNPDFANEFTLRGMGTTDEQVQHSLVDEEGVPTMMPVYIKAENPFDFDNPTHIDRVTQEMQRIGAAPELVEQLRGQGAGNWDLIEHDDVQAAIRALGFDAFYVIEGGVKNMGVYEPTQVKSAIGNNGDFDGRYADIRFSVRRLPDAIIGDAVGALAQHTDYADGKRGDAKAAMRVAADVVTPQLLRQLQDVQADAVLGVMVDEEGGTNAIPTAAAAHMAKGLGLDLGKGVHKSAGAKRTTLLGLDRVFNRPTFEGEVPAGTRYIVVDDTLTQGGTIAALAEHLHKQGAEVAAVVALTGKNYSSRLAPSDTTLTQLRAKLGDAENQFEQATGRRFEDLTESEARYLANYKPQSAIRARLDQATGPRLAGDDGARAGDQDAVKQSKRRNPQEDTEAFKAWFGDSKVVDADGQPLVVYHGTRHSFDEFKGEGRKGVDRLHYFTDDPNVANEYAGSVQYGAPNVMPAYVSLQNPFKFDANGDHWGSLPLDLFPEDIAKHFDERNILRGRIGQTPRIGFTDVIRGALAAGYDGVIAEKIRDGGGSYGEQTPSKVVVARKPEQIKSATGNNGDFDGSNADIRKSLPRRNGAAPWAAPGASSWDNMVYRMQDKQVDAKRVVDEIAKVNGAIQDDLDVYLNERLFHGRSAKRTQDFVNVELNPLAKEMAAAGLKIEDLDEFLHARHAKEANAVIAQRNPAMPDGGSGMTNAEVDNYFAKLNSKDRATLDAMAAKVDAMMAATRQLYVDYELESQDTVDSWGQMFKHYVPLMREDMESRPGIGQGYSVKGRETKGRTGSTRKVVDILANIAMQRERAIVRGEKNRVAQALVGLAYTNPNAEFWDVDSPKVEQVFNPKTGQVENRVDPMWKNRENAIVAKTREADGSVKEHAVVFNERNERALRMAESLKNLDAAQLEGLWGASAKVTRYFSAINTQYNPVFGIVNFMRDVQGAAINLGSTPLKDQKTKVLRNTVPALAGIFGDLRAQRKGGQGKSQWAALWDEFQMVGGQTGYRDLFRTSADRANAIRSAIDPHAWMQSKWGKIFTAGGALKVPMAVAQKHMGWMFDMLSDYNEAIENGVRLSAYKAGLDQGMSKERAAALAKNLTVDFNKKGQVAQQAGALYAFFNAAMQGTARMGEVLVTMEPGKPKTMRLSTTGKKIVGGGMMLGAMQAMAMAAAGFDDENPPDFVRERALIIPTFGLGGTPEKGYVSIPMPLGLHVIPNLGRNAVEFAMSGFEQPAQRAIKLMALMADAFNPIGNAGMSVQTLTPTALDPLVALTENKDFAGRPIAKESRNEAVPGHALGRDTSTVVGKAIAEGINWLSGGNEYVSGALSPTPDQIDYLIGQIFGGVGREYGKVEQSIASAVTGEELSTHKIPLVGRLIGNAQGQSSQSSSFYANIERVNRVETEAKAMAEDGKRDQAREFLRSSPERLLIAKANTAERQLTKLRQKKREMIKDGADPTQVKRVEEQITQVMLRFNTAVHELKISQKT